MASEDATVPQLVESITQSSPSAICSVTMAGGDISSNAHTNNPCQKDSILDEQTRKDLFTDTFCKVCGAVLQSESQRSAHYEGKKHAQKLRLYLLKKELQGASCKKEKVDRVDYTADQGPSLDRNKFCSLCNMVFSSPVVAQSHYVGKIHAKKLRQLSGDQAEWTPQTNHSCSPVTSQADTAAPPVVEYSPMSPVPEKYTLQEANTDQQPSTDNEVDLSDPDRYCKLCCASFNKPLVAQQHYSGKKHARNEARKRMMEEMEESGDPLECVVSDGKYVCPICSVALTSIEMYQAHMQGNKHQVKETMVAHLINTSKKSYNSFQEELADYIKVQKARGLEPKTQFRQERENDSGDYEEEELEDRPPPPPGYKHKNSTPYKYHDNHSFFYPPFNSLHPAKPPPHWEKVCRSENPHHNTQRGHYRIPTSSSSSSSDDSDGSSSDHSSGSYRKERKHKKKHYKESKHRSRAKIRRENETAERKKKRVEDADSGRDDDKQECKKEAAHLLAADKSKHKKEKRRREEQPADREAKKPKKAKKEEVQRTEEEILWDESILGF